MNGPRFLLVNPWIHDFAAYNLWIRPLGLLYLHSYLRKLGASTDYVDALHLHAEDARRWDLDRPERRDDGTGKFHSERITKPEAYADVPRYYRRYGIPPDVFRAKLRDLDPPDAIFVTSGMTYWYPGVRETILNLRRIFSAVPIYLGGTYASLCPEHAGREMGADRVVPGPWETALVPILETDFGLECQRQHLLFDKLPFPSSDLYPGDSVAAMRLTRGCPFSCDYCASDRLSPGFEGRSAEGFASEVEWNAGQGRRDIALYDDALLVNTDRLLVPALDEVLRRDVRCRFHTPNGLHARFMTDGVARLFRRSSFSTVRLSFESVAGRARDASDGKAAPDDLVRAMAALSDAGYARSDIGVYMLIGLPGQDEDTIRRTAEFIHEQGAIIRLAQYSPIPGTPMFESDWQHAKELAQEPLYHNSTIAPGWDFEMERYEEIKRFAKKLNRMARDRGGGSGRHGARNS